MLEGIILDAREVYTNSDGSGGTGGALATAIYKDLKEHVDLKDERLLQAQGRVLDDQYLNEPFIAGMNEPIMRLFEDGQSCKDRLWWPIEWDPAHWLDKVFSKYEDSCFVDCLLKRVALYHQLFRFGKMHSVARHTAKELKLPFRVTNAFAHQRFMSSSYLSLRNLADSLEVYIETFKDHDNHEKVGYKLYGQDFVHDLLAVLDLLWPLVALMLQAQAQWYPGWKLCSHIPLVKMQIERFLLEITKDEAVVTRANGDEEDELELLDDLEKHNVYVCPRLNKRIN
jgi:hypothetical protein